MVIQFAYSPVNMPRHCNANGYVIERSLQGKIKYLDCMMDFRFHTVEKELKV